MPERLRQAIPVAIGLVLFLVALEVLRVELRAVSWHDLTADVMHTPPSRLGLAVVLTALNYAALTGYDLLAFAYIGKTLPRAHIAVASFLAYAISNNVGFAMLSGASVRYRFYTRWGITAEELSRIVFSYSVTFWLGLFGLGGLSLLVSPLAAARELPAHQVLLLIGWLLMLTPPVYLLAAVLRKRPFRLRSFELPLPSPSIAVGQALLSAIEWTLAAAVLYVLLPPSSLSFLQFLGAFLMAILTGMASHVPGGVGVFEGLMILLLKPYLTSGQLLPALVVYRTVYYLAPLVVALIGLVTDAVRQHRAPAARISAAFGELMEQLAPRVLAFFTFLAGLVLLFSGATPAAAGRLELLTRVLPPGVIEVARAIHSHSKRAREPFVGINCGAIADTLLESELFGHQRGSFTGAVSDHKGVFEQAGGGTVLLDEIGDTTAALQVRLLRVLEEGEVRPVGGNRSVRVTARVIAATNMPLEEAIAEGRFRQDLYYRISVIVIRVPPLRDRRADIPLLIGSFLEDACTRAGQRKMLSTEALDALLRHTWPGNVRELRNTIERLVVSSRGSLIEAFDLSDTVTAVAAAPPDQPFADLPTLDDLERRYLLHVLNAANGNRTRAAEILGVDRRTLYRMAERFGIALKE